MRQYKCRETGIYHVREDCWKNDRCHFDDNKNSRIIIATFASNVDRVQQIINAAYKNGRKVIVEGRSMVNIIGTASELGYINIPDNTLIDIEQLKIIRMNRLSLLQPEVRESPWRHCREWHPAFTAK